METETHYCGAWYPYYESYRIFDYSDSDRNIYHKYCDTNDIKDFGCDNYMLCNAQTSKIGIIQYRCLGHDKETNSTYERNKLLKLQ